MVPAKKAKIKIAYADGRELVEALRPILAAHGYATRPDIALVRQVGECAALRELRDALQAKYLASEQLNLLELISLQVELDKLKAAGREPT